MIINETTQNWSQIIKEELGVENPQKLEWMAKYAQNHQVFEGLQSATAGDHGIYATPLNTLGIGNPLMPPSAPPAPPRGRPPGASPSRRPRADWRH